MSSSGSIYFQNNNIINSGASTTASTISAGAITFFSCNIAFPISTTGTSSVGCILSEMYCNAINTTPLTVNSSGQCNQTLTNFDGGTAPALTYTSGSGHIDNCVLFSSNTNAISGAGIINVSGISFNGSSSTIQNTLSVNADVQQSGTLNLVNALTVANGGTGRQTLTNHGVLVGAGTTAITQLSAMTDGQILIGKTFKEAQEILRNCNYRIAGQDNKPILLTMDRRLDRYNLYLEKGLIVKVDIG
jgi:hypothetical protein